MNKLRLTLTLFITFVGISHAQRETIFDFQVQKTDSTQYEIQLQLHEPAQVQFIEIYFMEKNFELAVEGASLNQKRDGNYYLAYNGKEKRVDPNNMLMRFAQDLGPLRDHSLQIKLMDKQFNQLDTKSHPVFEY